MTEFTRKAPGSPTAIKERGTGWYLPAVTTTHRPIALPHGDRQESRHFAVKQAKELIDGGRGDV